MNRKQSTLSTKNWTPPTDPVKRRAKERCELDHLFFTRYFFKERQGAKFRVNWHHAYISEIIGDVVAGRRQNVVINVAPGSSKTELVVINLIARGLALNPWAKFLHVSYSDDLALLNSETAREIVQSEEFKEFWELQIADDASAKKRWNVVIDGKKAGGVYAAALGGQITGFRAGRMVEGFQGAIIIDDPLKPEDAYSKTLRDKANRKLLSTIKSRKANPKTPIILIMQRLAEEDPTGFIKEGRLGGKWDFVEIPALLTDNYVEQLPEHYSNQIKGEPSERDADGRFSYWPYKEPLSELIELESKDRFIFSGQYMQRPTPLGGEIIRGADFKRYSVLPPLEYKIITGDTALETGKRNDYSVFQCWGKGLDGRLYLVDQIRGKWRGAELKRRVIAFWYKHISEGEFDAALRKMYIEKAASGTGLIQDIEDDGDIPVEGIIRTKDKLTRVLDVVSYIESGYVYLPETAPFVSDFVNECEAFTADDTHAHDDQIDAMCDGIVETLVKGKKKKSIYD